MKNISFSLSENFQFLEVKLSIHLNRRVFVMFNYRASPGKYEQRYKHGQIYPNPHYWSSICVATTSLFLLETAINIILESVIRLITALSKGVYFLFIPAAF